jgi:hypothetical protein
MLFLKANEGYWVSHPVPECPRTDQAIRNRTRLQGALLVHVLSLEQHNVT